VNNEVLINTKKDTNIAMIKDFISMVFPATCVSCKDTVNHAEKLICTSCRAKLPVTDHYLYLENDFKAKFYGKLPVKHAFAYLKYTTPSMVQAMLHQLKYKGVEEISSMLGYWHGAQLQQCKYMELPDIITFVPLHKSKLRKRGYNQVQGYATAISKTLGIPVQHDILARKLATKTQTKKGRFERWQNVNEIFIAQNKSVIQDKHILLTDDVVTTGATLEACGNRLLEAGARAVSFAAMATA